MALVREASKTLLVGPALAEPAPNLFSQRKREEIGRYRVLVDRQLKRSYTTSEAAEEAGLVIKQRHPVVQVAIYDAIDCTNNVIELPNASKDEVPTSPRGT